MGTNTKGVFLIVGLLLILLSAVLFGFDIYHAVRYEHAEAALNVVHTPKKGKKAHVSYEFQGKHYEDKVLSSYNGFVMKDGQSYTILIDPEKPDEPHTTSFFLDAMFLAAGAACAAAGLKND